MVMGENIQWNSTWGHTLILSQCHNTKNLFASLMEDDTPDKNWKKKQFSIS